MKNCERIGEGCPKNYTTLRSLYYPAFPQDFDFQPLAKTEDNEIIRLEEHLDAGILTFLFPYAHQVEGLQVSLDKS